jgi:DNA-binding YbaB/EbfC family protein
MNFSDIMEMLRNPQAVQAKVNELKEKTARVIVTGSAGGGMVRVTLNGTLEMLSCEISPEVVDPSDVTMLQDLVRAAFNDASAKVRDEMQKELSTSMEGLQLPPGLLGGMN